MSRTGMQRVKLGEDARFDLSLGAAARERRNRPIAIVALAAGFVLATLVFALYSVSARASSRRDLIRALDDQSHTEVLVDEWKKLVRAEADLPRGGAGQPGEFKISKMEDLSVRALMKSKPNTPRTLEDKTHLGVVISRYYYTEVRDPLLGTMLEWVRLGCAEISGLEVEGITLHPEPAGWRMDVTFRRWERAGS